MDDSEKKARNGSRGKPKSRNGCKTCKIRRVKCDETRPQCVRCKSFGFPCDGYLFQPDDPRPKRELLPKERPRSFREVARHPILLIVEPGSPKLQTELEYQYFSIFESRTASELCGYFDCDVWDRLILQVCHHEEYVREAIIAIGALQKSLDEGQHTGGGFSDPSIGKAHYTNSLQHYGKALRLMRECPQKEDEARLQNALISSLLTTCFESFIGNQEDALNQAQAGVDILSEWLSGHHKETQYGKAWGYPTTTSFVNGDLLGIFSRLDTQVMLFKDMHSVLHPLLEGTTIGVPDIPPRFSSIRQARSLWDIFIQRSSHWQYAFPQRGSTLDFGENKVSDHFSEEDAITQKFQVESIIYTTTLNRWHAAFLPLYATTRDRPGTKDFLGANVLELKYLATRFTVASSFGDSELVSDAFREDYVQAVELARDLLETYGRNRSPGRGIFVFDESLICALFLVGTRCRDCAIRREAISLLWKYPRREGLWDSSMAAKIASWIMNVEEQGMLDGFVPEAARLKIVNNDFILSQRKAVIQCSKLSESSGERVVLPEVTLTW